ncbi:glycoside hydrolase family 78 [Prevotella sp. CAG:1058]|nr:glycoside hydrolase family 78 [Prevotella sp. CAG:1058]
MASRIIIAALAALVSLCADAKLTVTRLTCNYQGVPVTADDGGSIDQTAITTGGIRLGWQMTADTNGERQSAYEITICENVTNKKVYTTGKVKSSQSQLVNVPALKPNTHGYYWQVRVWNEKGEASDLSKKQKIRVVPEKIDAEWIGAITRKDAKLPYGRFPNSVFKKDSFKTKWADVDTLSAKSIILRKGFDTGRKQITDAVVYVCGLGHYRLNINGATVGDAEFAPVWSEYDKTVYYNVFDVTDLITAGGNAVSVLLGNGMFNVQRMGRYSKLQTSFGPPQMLLRLEINYADGTRQVIKSGDDWKYSLSPITFNSIYGGESYDARLEQQGCCKAGFDDSGWRKAVVTEGPKGRLTPQTVQPVRIMERYGIKSWKPIPADSLASASKSTKREIHPSAFVADMGQNLAGFPEITVSGKRGQKVTLIVAEKLTRQGACDQRQTGRQHYYEYTLKGDGTDETWHPHFSYYGFRYIQVEGAVLEGQPNPDGLPVLKRLNSCFIYNSAEEVSSFECSNPLFTDTHRLIERAERSNMQGVLTDCPHREKLGWLEQDHLCGPSLLYNYDMTRYAPKVIRDITDTQKADGMVPTTAPQYISFGNLFDDSPEWGSTLVILPFMYYDQYGDSTLITDNYEPMRCYVDYLTTRADNGIVSHGLGDWYDYGPWRAGFSKNTPVPLVATAHYIFDLQLLVRAARMTGRTADAGKYSAMLDKTVESFNREFFNPDSCTYGTGSQTSNALPLYLGLTGGNKQGVLASLVNDIKEHGTRLTTGDVGNRYLFQTLAQNGLNELLYTMLNHYETPGYGFQLRHGATTLTEQWDPNQGSSLNHFMMGQIDEWLFKTLAGIQNQPGTHGLRHLLIQPTLVGDLQYVKASTHSLYGKISVDCTRTSLTVEIPVGSDATVVLPNGERKQVGSGQHTFKF